MKNCPYCGEEILKEAIKCRFCGEFLDPNAPNPRKTKGVYDPANGWQKQEEEPKQIVVVNKTSGLVTFLVILLIIICIIAITGL